MVNNKLKEMFAFLFSLNFILNGYFFGIEGVSLGTLVFIIIVVVTLLFSLVLSDEIILSKSKKNLNYAPIMLLLFLIVLTLISSIINNFRYSTISDSIIEVFKLSVIAISVSIVHLVFGDLTKLYKWLKYIAIISTIYLFIQYFAFYAFGIFLNNVFDFGFITPYYGEIITDINFVPRFFRPASFFVEPSYYGTFALIVLSLYLFDDKNKNKEKFLSALLSLGIILSTSTSSIYILILIWILYFWKNRNAIKIAKKPGFLIILIAFPILFILVSSSTEDLNIFITTIKYTLEKPGDFINISRLGGSYKYINYLKGIDTIIGIGIGNHDNFIFTATGEENVYLNSITLLFLWTGLIGIFGYTIFIISLLFKNYNFTSKALILIFIIKGFSSGIFFNFYSILILTLIYMTKNSIRYYNMSNFNMDTYHDC